MQPSDIAPLAGVLAQPEILSYLGRPWPDSLVITPLVDPEIQLGSNSIDLRLGSEFLITHHERIPFLDLTREPAAFEAMLRKAHDYVRVNIGEQYVLHEGESVLATTLEYVRLPESLAGLVFGRSSWDRLGISVPSTRIPSGFKGCISIQIRSYADIPVTLIPGTRICQLMLLPVSSPSRDRSRYGVVLHPTHSRIFEDPEIHTLIHMKFPLILGVVGTLASGKSSIAEYLVREHGFLHLSLATTVHDETRKRGLPTVLDELQNVGNSLRRLHGADVLVHRLQPRLEALPGGSYVVLEGIKNVAEIQELRKWPNFKVLAVDAPFEVRLERMIQRSRAGSPHTEEEFGDQDRRDRGIGEPEWGQGVDKCISEADFILENDGSLDQLYEHLEKWLFG